jgi:hypothetical protein
MWANLIATETPNRGASSATHVPNDVMTNRGTLAIGNDVTPNEGTLAVHVLSVVHTFDQVQHTIVPVFTLGNRMMVPREALPPRPDDDAAEPPGWHTGVWRMLV